MRKLAFFVVGGAVWLLLGAVPASADNGPHMTTVGQLTDRCAGCHRLHSGQAAYLLVEEEPALCYTCHGAGSTGASTDVQEGLGYTQDPNASAETVRTGTPGALRGGGFEYALINARGAGLTWSSTSNRITNVGVLGTGEPATSAHSVDESAQTSWGGGAAFSSTPNVGTTGVNLTCTSCHDPHGNTTPTYRILRTNPAGLPTSAGLAITCTPTGSGVVGDTCTNTVTVSGTTNTVTCTVRSTGSGATLIYWTRCNSTVYPTCYVPAGPAPGPWATCTPNIGAPPDVSTKTYTTTDYWQQVSDPTLSWAYTGNNARTSPASVFLSDMASWCSQCHTRYKASGGQTYDYDTGDAIYKYRHRADSASSRGSGGTGPYSPSPNCIQCHVAHGSNSATGSKSGALENPGGGTAGLGVGASPASADNRLLRIDQRGTCAACHAR